LGNYSNPPEWKEILVYFGRSELQNYFQKLAEKKIKAVTKP
jgi:ATP-binding cassette subfamily E protein 1